MIKYISLGSNCSITYQLKKHGLRTQAYPFDWAKINLSQLNNVLENNFDDFAESLKFKKMSQTHKYFGLDGYSHGYSHEHNLHDLDGDTGSESIILTNKYRIEFAHEILGILEIDNFKSRMELRISRFKNLKSIHEPKQICFIRIELNPVKSNWINDIKHLIKLLKKYIDNFKLILIINSNIDYQDYFPNFVKIIKFDNFSSDWKMDMLDWNEIFNDGIEKK
jgi:hypothetical protein